MTDTKNLAQKAMRDRRTKELKATHDMRTRQYLRMPKKELAKLAADRAAEVDEMAAGLLRIYAAAALVAGKLQLSALGAISNDRNTAVVKVLDQAVLAIDEHKKTKGALDNLTKTVEQQKFKQRAHCEMHKEQEEVFLLASEHWRELYKTALRVAGEHGVDLGTLVRKERAKAADERGGMAFGFDGSSWKQVRASGQKLGGKTSALDFLRQLEEISKP